MSHDEETSSGQRFRFGENWSRFLKSLSERKIELAQQSLCAMLGVDSMEGRTFLDIGSGSGLFSLAARRLGARVTSVDYDPASVFCTQMLRERYFSADENWTVHEGSILDHKFIEGLGQFDVVYSWGVLHHTGAMYQAFAEAAGVVKNHGLLFIAIYNDQGFASKYWTYIKRIYNQGLWGRFLMVGIHAPYLYGLRWVVRAASGRLVIERGMSLWYDMIDWLGGYPFEYAKPEDVFGFFHDLGFQLDKLTTNRSRMTCNEFVFQKRGGPGLSERDSP